MAQELLGNRSSESFDWMKTFHCAESKVTNPHTTRTAVMFDFARGTDGTQKGAPLSFQGLSIPSRAFSLIRTHIHTYTHALSMT